MSANKLALLRYRIIDKCLRNRFRKWTLNDLIEAVSDALYEYEGITSGVSKRTIQLDIQNMRSNKLGYNAPIIVRDRKYYCYEDKNYSITNSPLSPHDVDKLKEVVSLLKQFREFSYFEDLSSLVSRLEDKVISKENPLESPIQFDKNEKVKGTRWLHPLHRAILKKISIDLLYQSFKAEEPKSYRIFPYLLKEYSNRWFLLSAVGEGNNIRIFALDRIEDLRENPFHPYREAVGINIYNYFKDVIGISKKPGLKPETITFRVTNDQLPYLLTKPLHPSQKLLKKTPDKATLQITVIQNFELEKELLGWGEFLEVLSPNNLREKMISRLNNALNAYE